MKKIIGLLIIIAILTGCEPITEALAKRPIAETYENYQGKPFPKVETDLTFNSPGELFGYMRVNFEYKDDLESQGISDFWQSIDTTYRLQTGDCEDYAIFAAYHLEKMGYKVNVVCVTLEDTYGHALIELDGIIMEPYFPYPSDMEITSIKRLTVTECLSVCYSKFKN